jgi:hypothetical protein
MAEEFRDSPLAFAEYLKSLPDASPHKTIDRIDPDKGYERGNLRWATRLQQSRNLRAAIRLEDGENARDFADRALPAYSSEYVAKMAAEGRLEQVLRSPKKGWRTNFLKLEHEGKTYNATEFSRTFGVFNYQRVISLTRKGLSPAQILDLARLEQYERDAGF